MDQNEDLRQPFYIRPGEYKITVSMGDVKIEKTMTVLLPTRARLQWVVWKDMAE